MPVDGFSSWLKRKKEGRGGFRGCGRTRMTDGGFESKKKGNKQVETIQLAMVPFGTISRDVSLFSFYLSRHIWCRG
jgi:hypothetical protein